MSSKQLIELTITEELNWKNRFDNQHLSPESWAAKFGHRIYCGDLRKYSFPDKTFQAWIHQVFEILHTEGRVEELRIALLSAEEQLMIKDEIDKDWA